MTYVHTFSAPFPFPRAHCHTRLRFDCHIIAGRQQTNNLQHFVQKTKTQKQKTFEQQSRHDLWAFGLL